ncbi:MAG: translation elongation factor Ts [Patescibacteria group bacterium]|nr:translation elongation factor Ts [Patescibacteria group bacterium]
MADLDKVKELREATSISYAECAKALKEAGGDIEKAKEVLRKLGKKVARKKSSRVAGDGIVEAYIHSTGKVGVLLELRSETDFVARAKDFKYLAHEIAMQIASMDPEDVKELMAQDYIKDTSKKMKDLVDEAVAKLGENIVVQQFTRFEI